MGFYLRKPNPDWWRERERKWSSPPNIHACTQTRTHTHTHTSHPKAADTVVGLVHGLDVNLPVAIQAVIE